MSIAEQLTALTADKTAIENAITEKGGTLSQNSGFDTFATDIGTIPTGSNKFKDVVDGSVKTLTAQDLKGITSIHQYSFYGRQRLTSVVFPSTLLNIGAQAFRSCYYLTSVTFNEGLTRLLTVAFGYCEKLLNITLPTTISEIQSFVFIGCVRLQSIIILATTPPTLGAVNAFDQTNNCPIYVPADSLSAYQTATNWSALSSRLQAIPA